MCGLYKAGQVIPEMSKSIYMFLTKKNLQHLKIDSHEDILKKSTNIMLEIIEKKTHPWQKRYIHVSLHTDFAAINVYNDARTKNTKEMWLTRNKYITEKGPLPLGRRKDLYNSCSHNVWFSTQRGGLGS